MTDKKRIGFSKSFSQCLKVSAFLFIMIFMIFSATLFSSAAEKDISITVGKGETITLKSLGASDCYAGTGSDLFVFTAKKSLRHPAEQATLSFSKTEKFIKRFISPL